MYKYNRIYSPVTLTKLIKGVTDHRNSQELSYFIRKSIIEMYGFKTFLSFGLGRQALFAALKQTERKKKEVIAPVFCCKIIPHVIRAAGKKPVFADIDANTFGIDIRDVKKKITRNTSAVIVIHEFGNPVAVDDIISLKTHFDGIIIEDAALAMGSLYPEGSPVGNIGDYTIFSGGIGKPVSASKWGGLGVKNNKIELLLEKGHRQPSFNSFFHLLGLLVVKQYLIFNLLHKLFSKKVKEDSLYFESKLLTPSRLDTSLMLSHLKTIKQLHRKKFKIGWQIMEIIQRHGIKTMDVRRCQPLFSRIPMVFPNRAKCIYAEKLFINNGIEVKKPYYSSQFTVDLSEYKQYSMIANKILAITATQDNPAFLKSIDKTLIKYRVKAC